MKRRDFCILTAQAIATLGIVSCGASESDSVGIIALNNALMKFRSLPGNLSYLIEVERPSGNLLWQDEYSPDLPLIIGSAYKAFVVTKCLQDNEAGQLSLGKQITIDDSIRMYGSGLLQNVTGTVPLAVLLDAIMLYSDNTAADAAEAQVGADRVRALLASAGLTATRIPDSLRLITSYLAGAPLGQDIGWDGIQKVLQGIYPGTPRSLINDVMTISSTTTELVSFYRQALSGKFFTKPETLLQLKRIFSRGNATFNSMPETVVYAKGGNVTWLGLNALSYPGQIILPNGIVMTFAFALNWENSDPNFDFGVLTADFLRIVGGVLVALKQLHSGTLTTEGNQR